MWERRGAPGGGGVIYAERALLLSPLTVPARSQPEGAQRAGERALGAGFSRGGARPLPALGPVVSAALGAEEEQEANEESSSGAGRARGGGASPTPPLLVPAGEQSLNHPTGPEPVTPAPAAPGMV